MIREPGIDEEWRPVVGAVGYEVSSRGRVRSLDRTRTYARVDPASRRLVIVARAHRGRVLQPGTAKSGHQIVVLGRGQTRLVHRLVLEAFVGPAPANMEACHGDDDPANNNLENLRWGTRSENLADYRRNRGRFQQQRHA